VPDGLSGHVIMKNVGLNHIPSVKGQQLNLTLNLVFVAVFYVFLGAAVSYLFFHIFPSYDETWKKSSFAYQLLDVSAEVSAIVVVAFWLTYFVNIWIPILHVSPGLEHYVESFGGQMIFIYAMFIFLGTLDDKLVYVFKQSLWK
jgi:hypothetical protein